VPAGVNVAEGAVRILESHHSVDFEMEFGVWPFHKICWVAVGRGTLESESDRTPIGRDDFLLLPADWLHRFSDDSRDPLTLVILCLSKTFVGDIHSNEVARLWERALDYYPAGIPICARTAFHRTTLLELFRSALREQEDRGVGWETAMGTTANQLLIVLGRNYCEKSSQHKPSSHRTIEGAVGFIRDHPYEHLQISKMAERCGLSPRRFTDLFKEKTGQTFSNFLNNERIRYACRRITETGHILYACHESGFNDPAYFYRVFKKRMGVTPGEFARKNRQSS